jgi:SAM-dependent methyltransferase
MMLQRTVRKMYGYDPISVWRRASSRAVNLLSLAGLETAGKQVLDVGAGDGMLGVILNAFPHSVTLVDQEDWRHERALNVKFKKADCCKRLPFDDSSFDLVCSYNPLEHFHDPFGSLF